ncbi:hypothetical protein AN958_10751 [Leucoagaricus sp. SymC.cos]|nr:hypothetical protein AN958_10751 [Leucoagaricus sp. SymC.cos]
MTYPTDPFEQLHYNMVRAHNTFKLGYENITKKLDQEKESIENDLPNFLGYCQAWATSIIVHHDSEEEIVFPFLNEKMDFASEKEAHEIIHKGISDLGTALLEAKADPSKFSAQKIKQQIEQLQGPLYQHLDAEVKHIKSSELKQAGFGDAELKDLNHRLDKYAQSHGDPFVLVPYMRSHTPPEFKDHWPPMPWVLHKLVIPYVLTRRHAAYVDFRLIWESSTLTSVWLRYWKYSPYSVS